MVVLYIFSAILWKKRCDCTSVASVWRSVRALVPDIEYIDIYSVFPDIEIIQNAFYIWCNLLLLFS